MVAVTELRTAGEAEIIVSGWGLDADPIGGEVERVGLRSMDLRLHVSGSSKRLSPGQRLWVNAELPTGETIRPLVEVTAVSGASVRVRYLHLFPNHLRTLRRCEDTLTA